MFLRHEILSMVKKHSKSLGKMSLDEQDASDVEMDSNFWHGVFDVYFIRGMESRKRQDDDLLFFVRKLVCCFHFFLWTEASYYLLLFNVSEYLYYVCQSCKSYGLTENDEAPAPYFVRRWAPKVKNCRRRYIYIYGYVFSHEVWFCQYNISISKKINCILQGLLKVTNNLIYFCLRVREGMLSYIT